MLALSRAACVDCSLLFLYFKCFCPYPCWEKDRRQEVYAVLPFLPLLERLLWAVIRRSLIIANKHLKSQPSTLVSAAVGTSSQWNCSDAFITIFILLFEPVLIIQESWILFFLLVSSEIEGCLALPEGETAMAGCSMSLLQTLCLRDLPEHHWSHFRFYNSLLTIKLICWCRHDGAKLGHVPFLARTWSESWLIGFSFWCHWSRSLPVPEEGIEVVLKDMV